MPECYKFIQSVISSKGIVIMCRLEYVVGIKGEETKFLP